MITLQTTVEPKASRLGITGWMDSFAFLRRQQLFELSVDGGSRLSAVCVKFLHRRNARRLRDLRIRWNPKKNENIIEVWRAYQIGYQQLPFPEVEPPENIIGFKEISISKCICDKTLRFLQLSKRLLTGCELIVEDWHAFCAGHPIAVVDDFLELFRGRAHRAEVDGVTPDSEPFLAHPTMLRCRQLAMFDPDKEFSWTEPVDWLHHRVAKSQNAFTPSKKQQTNDDGGDDDDEHAKKAAEKATKQAQQHNDDEHESGKLMLMEANTHVVSCFLENCVKKFRAERKHPVEYTVKIFSGDLDSGASALHLQMAPFDLRNEATGERMMLRWCRGSRFNQYHLLRRYRPTLDEKDAEKSDAAPNSGTVGTWEDFGRRVSSTADDECRAKVVLQMLRNERNDPPSGECD